MKLRTAIATGALAALTITFGSLATATAGGVDDLGEFTVGDTIYVTFDCPTDFNDFFLFLGDTKVDEDLSVDASGDYLLGFPYDTSGLEPGEYSGSIECDETSGVFDFSFSLAAFDPCAPIDSIVTPKGPGRAPHGAPIDCEGSGLPDAGSESTTVLLFGSLAVVAGTGLLIARRRTLA